MSGTVYNIADIPEDLRGFFVRAEIGLEDSLHAWVDALVAVFGEVRRVLKTEGVCFVNIGDAYAGGGRGGDSGTSTMHSPQPNHSSGSAPRITAGLKPKDLMGQPWRLAFALQDDGWWLRQEIIWAKDNPMPESVRDRCTKAHEQIFLLSKSERYYWNFEATQEPVNGGAHARRPGNKAHTAAALYEQGDEHHRTKGGLVAYAGRQRAKYKTPDGWDTRTGQGGHGSFHIEGREKGQVRDVGVGHNARPSKAVPNEGVGRREGPPGNPAERKLAAADSGTKNNDSFDDAMAVMPDTRNMRSVWSFPSEPLKEAHFATFPTELPRRCIAAGCPPGGVVLDPFGGAGTTGVVADRMQRDAVLIELNPAYIEIARKRIHGDAPLFASVEVA